MDKEKLFQIRDQFPILQEKINGHQLTYLDNAATAQVPTFVQNQINHFNQTKRANVHRSVDTLGIEATNEYEKARVKVQKFINAKNSKEVIFTAGCTDSLNLVAATYGEMNIHAGDEIVVTTMEHHSNLIPWQQLALRKKAHLKFIELNDDQQLDLADAEKKITDRTKIVAIAHASNVLGTVNPIKKISKLAHKHGAVIVVDGAQAAGHMPIDVQEMDTDFYAFSGHKMFAPDGIGVLYGKEKLLAKMPPYRFGGEMIEKVTRENSAWAQLPQKFEAGTPNISGAISLGAAIDFIEKIGISTIQKREHELVNYLLPKLEEIEDLSVYGPKNASEHTGVIAFNLKSIHPHDLATALDFEGIEIRAGHHCAQPLMEDLGVESTARISFSVFNLKEDCDHLLQALTETKEFFTNGTK